MATHKIEFSQTTKEERKIVVSKSHLVIGVVVLSVIIFFFITNFRNTTPNSENHSTNTEATSSENNSVFGKDIVVGESLWAIQSFENIGLELSPTNGVEGEVIKSSVGKFIRVRFVITNKSSKDLQINLDDIKLKDSSEKEYVVSKNKEKYISKDENYSGKALAPNESILIGAIFEVSPDATDFSLILRDLTVKDSPKKDAYLGK